MSWKLPTTRNTTGRARNAAEKTRNGTTPSQVRRECERAGRAEGTSRALIGGAACVTEPGSGSGRDPTDYGYLVIVAPTTAFHWPVIRVLAVASWSPVGKTAPVTSGSLAATAGSITLRALRSV